MKKLLLTTLLLISALLGFSQDSKMDSLMSDLQQIATEKGIEPVINMFDSMLTYNYNDSALAVYTVVIGKRHNEIDRVLDLMEKHLPSHKNNKDFVALLGFINSVKGDNENSIKYFEQALKLEKEKPLLNNTMIKEQLVNMCRKIGDFEKALQYALTIELDEDKKYYQQANVAVAYNDLNQPDKALSILKPVLDSVLKLDNHEIIIDMVYAEIGKAYYLKGKYKEALFNLDKSGFIFSKRGWEFYYMLCICKEKLKEDDLCYHYEIYLKWFASDEKKANLKDNYQDNRQKEFINAIEKSRSKLNCQ